MIFLIVLALAHLWLGSCLRVCIYGACRYVSVLWLCAEGLCFNPAHSSSPAGRNPGAFLLQGHRNAQKAPSKSHSVVILQGEYFGEKCYPSIPSQISTQILTGFFPLCLEWLPAPTFLQYWAINISWLACWLFGVCFTTCVKGRLLSGERLKALGCGDQNQSISLLRLCLEQTLLSAWFKIRWFIPKRCLWIFAVVFNVFRTFPECGFVSAVGGQEVWIWCRLGPRFKTPLVWPENLTSSAI